MKQCRYNEFVERLKRGGVVFFPTDTVWGMGCDMLNKKAVGNVYEMKGRPEEKALPVLISDEASLVNLVEEISEAAKILMARFWPGALTLVFKKRQDLPDFVTGKTGTIAVRLPDHEPLREFIRRCGGAIASTSANKSGEDPCYSADAVQKVFGEDAAILSDDVCGHVSSTIVDVSGGDVRVLRQGTINIDNIR